MVFIFLCTCHNWIKQVFRFDSYAGRARSFESSLHPGWSASVAGGVLQGALSTLSPEGSMEEALLFLVVVLLRAGNISHYSRCTSDLWERVKMNAVFITHGSWVWTACHSSYIWWFSVTFFLAKTDTIHKLIKNLIYNIRFHLYIYDHILEEPIGTLTSGVNTQPPTIFANRYIWWDLVFIWLRRIPIQQLIRNLFTFISDFHNHDLEQAFVTPLWWTCTPRY